jgi:hypothetical protein
MITACIVVLNNNSSCAFYVINIICNFTNIFRRVNNHHNVEGQKMQWLNKMTNHENQGVIVDDAVNIAVRFGLFFF